MNLKIIVVGLLVAYVLHVFSQGTSAIVVGVLAVAIGLFSGTKTAKRAASSNIMEPIIVESTWGESIKPMPKSMTIAPETLDQAKVSFTETTWGKHMAKGIPGIIGAKIGKWLKD